MKSNEKKRWIQGFQIQVICYSLLSMLLTALTIGILVLSVLGISALLKEEAQESSLNGGIPGSINSLMAGPDANRTLMGNHPSVANNESIQQNDSLVDNGSIQQSGTEMIDSGNMPRGQGRIRRTVIILALAVLSFFLFVVYFLLLTRKFARYLREIERGIGQLAKGEFGTRIEVKQSNELTQIAESLNSMAEELDQRQEAEQRSENAKSDVIASIAHDLRTPLTSIIGYLELVAEKELTAETREHYISVAYRKAKRLQQLTEDLFTYTKYGSGELKLELRPLNAVMLIEQLVEEAYPNIQDNNLELEVERKAEELMVNADGILLARAYSNLLGNAIKYGRYGKVLRVVTERVDNKAVVRIINFGEVIPEKDIDLVFKRFYRVDSSRGEEQGGTGLGLAIAQNIVTLHHGEITVKSDTDGTEFAVILPLAENM